MLRITGDGHYFLSIFILTSTWSYRSCHGWRGRKGWSTWLKKSFLNASVNLTKYKSKTETEITKIQILRTSFQVLLSFLPSPENPRVMARYTTPYLIGMSAAGLYLEMMKRCKILFQKKYQLTGAVPWCLWPGWERGVCPLRAWWGRRRAFCLKEFFGE